MLVPTRSAFNTVMFNVVAPSGVTASAYPPGILGEPPNGLIQAAANVYPPSMESAVPILGVGDKTGNPATSLLGFALYATGSVPSGGQYQWVQLINEFRFKRITIKGRETCTLVGSANTLDFVYPYDSLTLPSNLTPGNATNDAPDVPLQPDNGERAASFSATMYLMWVPQNLTGCPAGNACTIPVPQGYVQ